MRIWQRVRLQVCCMFLPELKWLRAAGQSAVANLAWALPALDKPQLFNGDHIGALMYAKLAVWWNDPVNGGIRLRRHYLALLQCTGSTMPVNDELRQEGKRLEVAYKELEACYLWSVEREDLVDRITRRRKQLNESFFDRSQVGDDPLYDVVDDPLPRLLEEEHQLRKMDSTYLGLLLDNRYFMSEHYRVTPDNSPTQ